VIIEAIQGVGGISVATDGFLRLVRQLCDQYNAVFIADEVQCGYGRTGKFFATDHAGVNADIYTMAKGMGNGFPIGGILVGPKFQPKHGMLGTTFGGNHLACAAALAVLEVIEKDNLVKTAKESGKYLMNELCAVQGLQNVRGKGLMIGLDLPDNLKELRKNLLQQHHVFTGEAKPNTVRLLPALSIGRTEMDEFLAALRGEVSRLNNVQNVQVSDTTSA
jgi:acetylornithine aminotransferase